MRQSAILLLLLLAAGTAGAEEADHPVTMWRVDGAENRLYLLGSIHVLRPADHPLPPAIDEAYADAGTLVMEMDVDDTDPAEMQKLIVKLGSIQDGRSLKILMGAKSYARAEDYAARANIPLEPFARSEPWLAAIRVEQLMLARVGFNQEYGIEQYLAQKASADGKAIIGLETIHQQLEFLDGMSLDAQRALLLQSLEESIEIGKVMDDLVRAWRYGDVEFLETKMLDDMKDETELYEAIVLHRNRQWADKIATLAKDAENYLIVVGALHLIGDDGVPALLRERGLDVRQMRSQISTISKSSFPAPQSGHRQDNGTSSQRVPAGIPD